MEEIKLQSDEEFEVQRILEFDWNESRTLSLLLYISSIDCALYMDTKMISLILEIDSISGRRAWNSSP